MALDTVVYSWLLVILPVQASLLKFIPPYSLACLAYPLHDSHSSISNSTAQNLYIASLNFLWQIATFQQMIPSVIQLCNLPFSSLHLFYQVLFILSPRYILNLFTSQHPQRCQPKPMYHPFLPGQLQKCPSGLYLFLYSFNPCYIQRTCI